MATKDQLLSRKAKLIADRDKVLAEIKEVQAQLNDLEAADIAQGIVDDVSPVTRDHLARILQPDSVNSSNEVRGGNVS